LIRVLLVDDHEVVRIGLAQLLMIDDELVVVGQAGSGEDAFAQAMEQKPDVVLMDLNIPGIDGIEATRRIVEAVPSARVVVLTSFSERDRILRALEAGAIGFLLKDATADELRQGVRSAARGESPLAPSATGVVIDALAKSRAGTGLSERELQVLTLLSSGLPNRAIARQLFITEKTVKAHVTSIFRRIGVSDRMAAMAWAHRRGLVHSDDTKDGVRNIMGS
jgi:DNA-binding NarL/FixJ family response regulator